MGEVFQAVPFQQAGAAAGGAFRQQQILVEVGQVHMALYVLCRIASPQVPQNVLEFLYPLHLSGNVLFKIACRLPRVTQH